MKTVIYSALIITLPILCLAEYDEAAFAEYEPTGKVGKHLKVGAFNNYCDDPKYYEDFSVCVNLSFKESIIF